MPWESIIPNVLAGEGQPLAASSPAAAMDNEQFAAFYARSARSLWAYLARVSRDPALADDLTQESYVRFLCAITRKTAKWRRGGICFELQPICCAITGGARSPLRSNEMPEELFTAKCGTAQSDSQAMLEPAMAQMRPRDRQLLWLAYAEGYSHHEIAEVTGLASASIRLLLFRARRKMARLLRQGGKA